MSVLTVRAVTFDLWNTLLVSAPGAVEVRSRFWRQVIRDRGLDIDDDLLHATLSMLPARFDASRSRRAAPRA